MVICRIQMMMRSAGVAESLPAKSLFRSASRPLSEACARSCRCDGEGIQYLG
jgi:hypothetical protein